MSAVSCGRNFDNIRPPKTYRLSPTIVVEDPTNEGGSLPEVLSIRATSEEKFCEVVVMDGL